MPVGDSVSMNAGMTAFPSLPVLSRKELVDPSGLSEEQLKEIPYTKVE